MVGMMKEEMNQKMIVCECQGEALLLTKFTYDPDKEIYLSIYTIGQFHRKPTIMKRLKYCWYHLKSGKKYEDQMILTHEKAREIGEWLLNNIEPPTK